MNKITIYIAIYKNEANIMPCYESINKEIVPYIDDYEIVFVDDASPDDSWKILRELEKGDKHVKLLKHSRNFGAIAATFSAMKYATGDCFMPKACDLQEPASLLLDMYEKWKDGNKVVLAVRNSRQDPFVSRCFSNLYYKIMRRMAFTQMPEGGFDTYMIDRQVRDEVLVMKEKNSTISLQLLWAGHKTALVRYDRRKREIGKSSWTFSKKMKLFIDSVASFSYVPIRLMTVIGGIYTFVAFIFMARTIIAKLFGEIQVEGYTTLLSIMLFSFGLIMLSFGILGEYIWRILDATRNRPISVIEEKVGFTSTDE